MTAFIYDVLFCSFISLRTLSIHLSLCLPRGLSPTFIVVTSFVTLLSSLPIIWPYHERRFWVTHVVIGLTIASLLNFSFPILPFFLFCHESILEFSSRLCVSSCCSALCSAKHSLQYNTIYSNDMFVLQPGTSLSIYIKFCCCIPAHCH